MTSTLPSTHRSVPQFELHHSADAQEVIFGETASHKVWACIVFSHCGAHLSYEQTQIVVPNAVA